MLVDTRQRLTALTSHVRDLEAALVRKFAKLADAAQVPAPNLVPTEAVAEAIAVPDVAPPPPAAARAFAQPPESISPRIGDAPPPPAAPQRTLSERFETLVGGQLPIWIGGIAIIFAGIFLVRYSIEAGLLGPDVRALLAALLGLACIALSELGATLGTRFPRMAALDEDPRIGQSLAGAGIAILYGTLYMAAELYGLIGSGTAFGLLLVVTVAAFVLALRRGPGTALLGLGGGYAAPLVAGLADGSIAPLLGYLVIFTAAMFGVAAWQRWRWLLLAASGINALWTGGLLLGFVGTGLASGDQAILGFAVLLVALAGAGAALMIPAREERTGPLAIATPLILGLVQLAALVPLLSPQPVDWALYGLLSAATIGLAWRRPVLSPLAIAALLIALILLTASAATEVPVWLVVAAGVGIALIFGLAGQAMALRESDGKIWSLIAVLGPSGAVIASAAVAMELLSDLGWGVLAMTAAAQGAVLAWRAPRTKPSAPLTCGTAAALVMTMLAVGWLVDLRWLASCYAALTGIAAAWAARNASPALRRLPVLPLVVATGLMAVDGAGLLEALAASLAGVTDLFALLPAIGTTALRVALPGAGLIAGALAFPDGTGRTLRIARLVIGGAALVALAWVLAKQPFAIGSLAQFEQHGFLERMLITYALAAGAYAALHFRDRALWLLQPVGLVLGGVALFRVVWFDVLLLDPLLVRQALGPAPLANLGTLHFALVAAALWLSARTGLFGDKRAQSLRIGSLAAMALATLVSVRQMFHGSIIADAPLGHGETYALSAALLVLGLAWLGFGLLRRGALLRVAGLGLVTLVTFKIFLLDAASLGGLLRVLSFLGLGVALIGIGWAYNRVMKPRPAPSETA